MFTNMIIYRIDLIENHKVVESVTFRVPAKNRGTHLRVYEVLACAWLDAPNTSRAYSLYTV